MGWSVWKVGFTAGSLTVLGCLVPAWHIPSTAVRLESSQHPFTSNSNALAAGLGHAGENPFSQSGEDGDLLILESKCQAEAQEREEKKKKNNPKASQGTQMVEN